MQPAIFVPKLNSKQPAALTPDPFRHSNTLDLEMPRHSRRSREPPSPTTASSSCPLAVKLHCLALVRGTPSPWVSSPFHDNGLLPTQGSRDGRNAGLDWSEGRDPSPREPGRSETRFLLSWPSLLITACILHLQGISSSLPPHSYTPVLGVVS